MKLKTSAILPAVLALGLALAPAALAGTDKGGGDAGGGHHGGGHNKNGGGTPGPQGPQGPQGPGGGGGKSNFGTGNGHIRSFKCSLNGYTVYVGVRAECMALKRSLAGGGYGYQAGYGSVYGGVSANDTGYAYGGGHSHAGGYGYYQPQRVIRYVAMPSPAARKQAEKRARKAARLAAEAQAYGGYAAGGYSYGAGGMIGYGNGLMVGGYGNNVMVHGNVYAGNGYGYGGQVVVSKKKRKGKKARSVVHQQPGYVMAPGYGYVVPGYGYGGPVMLKGGGY